MWQAIADREKRRVGLPVKITAGKIPAGLAALEALKDSSRRLGVFSRNIEPKVYGRVGNLEVRLARTWSEIKLAQRLRYQVYKANADFLYVSLGVFTEAVTADSGGVEPEASRLTGRGKSYYQFASAYAERLYGSRAGIAEVMDKLSRNFESYTKVMTWMSGEYLNLVRRLSEGEVFHIERDAQVRFEDAHKAHTWDALLDSYVEWQKTHATEARRRLGRAARELKRVDPSFSLRAFRTKWGAPRRS